MLKNFRVKHLVSFTVMAIATSIGGCSTEIAEAQSKPKVVATHNIICDLVETIAEDTVDLTCLIDRGQDPHTYRPTPSQRKAIEEAQLIFYGGYQLEPRIIELLAGKKIPKVALYEEVVAEPIQTESGHSEAEHSEAEHSEAEEKKQGQRQQAELEPDPHVWHNVENTVAMVELLQGLFLQANPTATEVYLKNSVDLTEKLWQLDAWIKEQIATIPEGKKVLVTTHDSLNYYVQAYGLEDYKTLQGISPQASPTASQVRELAMEIRQTGVPTIFVESTASDRVISNVARAAKVELSESQLFVDGLGTTNNYTEMMSHNTCAIVNGLKGKCKPFKAEN